jgi:hypothetical protein
LISKETIGHGPRSKGTAKKRDEDYPEAEAVEKVHDE